jgi:hypothetical protein
MKKFTRYILMIILLFSIVNNTFAEEWAIEQLLDLNYGEEEYQINLIDIKYVDFKTDKNIWKYEYMRSMNNSLKSIIKEKYRNGDYAYHTVNGIITNQKNFIYYTNKYFSYLRLKEKWETWSEINEAILSSYRSMKSYYSRLKVLAMKSDGNN